MSRCQGEAPVCNPILNDHTRDLAIIKVSAPHNERSPILDIINVFRARVVDFALDSLTIEITGGEEKVDRLLEVLRPYGILEMVRTGIVAMRRGTKSEEQAAAAAAAASGNGAATVAADDNVSYSV